MYVDDVRTIVDHQLHFFQSFNFYRKFRVILSTHSFSVVALNSRLQINAHQSFIQRRIGTAYVHINKNLQLYAHAQLNVQQTGVQREFYRPNIQEKMRQYQTQMRSNYKNGDDLSLIHIQMCIRDSSITVYYCLLLLCC